MTREEVEEDINLEEELEEAPEEVTSSSPLARPSLLAEE